LTRFTALWFYKSGQKGAKFELFNTQKQPIFARYGQGSFSAEI
jgi:hypothetical protein